MRLSHYSPALALLACGAMMALARVEPGASPVRIVVTEKGDGEIFKGTHTAGEPDRHSFGDELEVPKSTYESLKERGFATRVKPKSLEQIQAEEQAAAQAAADAEELAAFRAAKAAQASASSSAGLKSAKASQASATTPTPAPTAAPAEADASVTIDPTTGA